MPAAEARLLSDPVPSNATRHTRRSTRSRFSVAARLIGATSSQDAIHTSSTERSSRKNLRASVAVANKRSHSCAARFSPASPSVSGCCRHAISSLRSFLGFFDTRTEARSSPGVSKLLGVGLRRHLGSRQREVQLRLLRRGHDLLYGFGSDRHDDPCHARIRRRASRACCQHEHTPSDNVGRSPTRRIHVHPRSRAHCPADRLNILRRHAHGSQSFGHIKLRSHFSEPTLGHDFARDDG